jgi:hypothetical protein
VTALDNLGHDINTVVNATIDLHDWAGGLKSAVRRGDLAEVRRVLELLQKPASDLGYDVEIAIKQLDKVVSP